MDKQEKSARRNAKEMFPLIKDYESRGLTQQAFCAEHGLKVSTFSYWRRKYLARGEESGSGFVSLVPEGLPSGDITLEYGGVVLRLGKEVSPDYVVSLVHKLAGRC
jgi:hypothetical protein